MFRSIFNAFTRRRRIEAICHKVKESTLEALIFAGAHELRSNAEMSQLIKLVEFEKINRYPELLRDDEILPLLKFIHKTWDWKTTSESYGFLPFQHKTHIVFEIARFKGAFSDGRNNGIPVYVGETFVTRVTMNEVDPKKLLSLTIVQNAIGVKKLGRINYPKEGRNIKAICIEVI